MTLPFRTDAPGAGVIPGGPVLEPTSAHVTAWAHTHLLLAVVTDVNPRPSTGEHLAGGHALREFNIRAGILAGGAGVEAAWLPPGDVEVPGGCSPRISPLFHKSRSRASTTREN